jgi:hypothetical protein
MVEARRVESRRMVEPARPPERLWIIEEGAR